MTYAPNLGNAITRLPFVPVAAQTTSTNSTAIDIQQFEGQIALLLDSAAGTGTTPTLDLKLQDSADNSTFADVTGATFTQVTNVASAQKLVIDAAAFRRYVRVASTITGTTPSFTFSVVGVATNKYVS